MLNRFCRSTSIRNIILSDIKNISSSTRFDAGKLWRQSVGLPKLQTARGPLIDLPDYSFVGMLKLIPIPKIVVFDL